uniref:DDE-1 domain-containing protein n=1 Tax=Ditylenchus dipsaci TaxID=166011 RepID=A0A915EBI8_9BILA
MLYVDNCSAHPLRLTFSNITIRFFLPNTTALSQPMDQGIIQNLKAHYLQTRLPLQSAECASLPPKVLKRSQVVTIANCFRHAAFKIDDVPPAEEDDDAVDGLLLAWARLQDLGDFEEGEMEDYLHIDDKVVTDGAQTLEDIVEEIAANNSQLADSQTMDVDVEDVDPVEPPNTSIEALKAMEIVRRYTEKNFADLSILKCSDTLDEAFYQLRAKNTTQKKLTDYFSFDI